MSVYENLVPYPLWHCSNPCWVRYLYPILGEQFDWRIFRDSAVRQYLDRQVQGKRIYEQRERSRFRPTTLRRSMSQQRV